MLEIILVSMLVSFIITFSMMRFHMKMLDAWMEKFFKEELVRLKDIFKN